MGRINLVIIGISCVLVSKILTAQVYDEFSDGNLTSNPAWAGDTARFEVNAQEQLHLKSTGTDSSYICTPQLLLDSCEWMFWIKMSFSASANNYSRIYLASDSANPLHASAAYYLQLGEAGSSDAIELFRQQGGQRFSVCRGREGFIAGSFAIRIRLTRDLAGNWTLAADSTGGHYFQQQATGFDNAAINTQYFCIYCKYTSSNATKFYFDDIVVRPVMLDLSPPTVKRLMLPDAHHIKLTFSEAFNPDSLDQSTCFTVSQGVGNPASLLYSLSDLTRLTLYFTDGFESEHNYDLQVKGITDLSGNRISDTLISFIYYRPGAYDVVVNEIMADPEPQVGLPPVEYVELFNTSPYPVYLDGWILQAGNATHSLPPFTLPSTAYAIIADSCAGILFSSSGHFLGLSSFSLANDGAAVTLSNDDGQVIHSVSYTEDWYDDTYKAQGGWSLEQLDPLNPCGGKSNWKCSQSNLGGTPGHFNSVYGENPDLSSPSPVTIGVIDPRNILVYFNESIDSNSFGDIHSYNIQPENILPESISLVPPGYTSLKIMLPSSMEPKKVYTLVFLDTLRDCAGNARVDGYSVPFGLPLEPDSGDVVINEILYDPELGVPEFFELYNASGKIISLNSLMLSENDSISFQITGTYVLNSEPRLFFPGDYLAFTSDPIALSNNYKTCDPDHLLTMNSIPSFTNTGGCISLVNRNEEIIDLLIYSDDMHYPLLSTTKGVSLERISAAVSSRDHDNWHSASSSCGYATPALKNSQSAGSMVSEAGISIDPSVFSPDNDGYQDLVFIRCHPGEPGYVANISIFNNGGQLVRNLVNNKLLGTDELFFWDGTDDRGGKSPIGMYILYFEFFNMQGSVRHCKKVIVLGGRL
jgi:hypothetical protein